MLQMEEMAANRIQLQLTENGIVQPFRAEKGVNRALLVTSMKIGTMVEFDVTNKM